MVYLINPYCRRMKRFIPFLVALPSLFFSASAFADECERGWCKTAVREGGGYIRLNVVERNYPYITFQTTFEKHKSQVDCTQFKLRYMSDDGSYSPWDTSLPDFRDQAKIATACHIYFSAQDFK
jgi:hypothetical protein